MTVNVAPSLVLPRSRLFPEERRLACGAALEIAVVLLASTELERFMMPVAPTLIAVGLLLIMQLSKLPIGVPVPVMLTPATVLKLMTELRTLIKELLPINRPVGSPSRRMLSSVPPRRPPDDCTVIPDTAQFLMLVSLTNRRPLPVRLAKIPWPFPAELLPTPVIVQFSTCSALPAR